ncbi:MAG: carboxypeptidase regulatory-like domain-containing protein [Planctomycetota bacterium]
MTRGDDLEKKLQNLGRQISSKGPLVDSVMKHIDEEDIGPSKQRRPFEFARKIMKVVPAGITMAAAIIIIVAVITFVIKTPRQKEEPVTARENVLQTKPATTEQIKPIDSTGPDIPTELKRLEEVLRSGNANALAAFFAAAPQDVKTAAADYLAKLVVNDPNVATVLKGLAQNYADANSPMLQFLRNALAVVVPDEAGTISIDVNMSQIYDQNGLGVDILVIDKDGFKPLANADVRFNLNESKVLKTDRDGYCWIDFGEKVPDYLSVKASKDGYVPMMFAWQGEMTNNIPDEFTFELPKGISIGGKIQDEQGSPVEGVNVTIGLYAKESTEIPWVRINDYVIQTDKNGKWRCNIMPEELDGFSIKLSHPGYTDQRIWFPSPTAGCSEEELRSQGCVMLVKKGAMLYGYVYDVTDAPIKGASVLLGQSHFDNDNPRTITDENGRFDFAHTTQGEAIITAQASGYAPIMKELDVYPGMDTVEFELSPGNSIFAHVVDVNGRAVADAGVNVDGWQGYQTINWRSGTDSNGRFHWSEAPEEEVEISVYNNGYMGARNNLTPSDEEYEIVLYPLLAVSGSVVDANTGEPIRKFTATKGIDLGHEDGSLYWEDGFGSQKKFTNGTYQMQFEHPYPGHLIRIDAEGYLPGISRVFQSDEGAVTYDFRLEKGQSLAGTVYLPDGNTAIGAEVYIVKRGRRLNLENGRNFQKRDSEYVVTDSQGHFSFQPQIEKYKFVVIHDLGFADVTENEFAETTQIRLQAWGCVEGALYIGSSPAANEMIHLYNPQSHNNTENLNYYCGYNTTTNANGHFKMDRVMPGQMKVMRRTSGNSIQQDIQVLPGETVYVTLKGSAIRVTGRFIIDTAAAANVNWKYTNGNISAKRPLEKQIMEIYNEIDLPRPPQFEQMSVAQVMQWYQDWGQSEQGRLLQKELEKKISEKFGASFSKSYDMLINPDGSFIVDTIEPGEYNLMVRLYEKGSHGRPDFSKCIAVVEHPFTVPEEAIEEESIIINLGTLELENEKPLELGRAAPPFEIDILNGHKVRLSDYAGKVLLINFYSLPNDTKTSDPIDDVRRIYNRFAHTGTFNVIGITQGPLTLYEDLVRKYIDEKELLWPQAVLESDNKMLKSYDVNKWPYNILIDRDGKVIAADIVGTELENTIAEILKQNQD